MGILYLSGFNSPVIEKQLREAGLQFSDLFTARPHIFIGRNNPLAGRKMVTLEDLRDLPCLTYDQGDQNALYYSEEILSSMDHDKSIMVTDKSTIVDLMVGTAGYTISSGLCPSYLRGNEIVSIPLDVDETIRVGVITQRDAALSQLARDYLAILYRLVRDSLTEENFKGAE